jgi:hypothetical protein
MLDNLNKITSMYTDKYLTLGSSQGIYTAQKEKLTNTLHAIEKQIDAKNDVISTYDRELKDRMAASTPYTFWRLRGISTLQDWVLFCFFFIYGLIFLCIMILAVKTDYPAYNIVVTILCGGSLGVVIMGTIVRFA